MTRVISWFDSKKWTQFPEFVFEVKEDFRENYSYETIYPPYKNGEIEDFKQKYYYPLVKKYGSKHIILEEKEYQDYYEPMYSVIIKDMYYRYTCKVKYENAITKEYFNWINEIDSKITNLEWIDKINKVDITIEEDENVSKLVSPLIFAIHDVRDYDGYKLYLNDIINDENVIVLNRFSTNGGDRWKSYTTYMIMITKITKELVEKFKTITYQYNDKRLSFSHIDCHPYHYDKNYRKESYINPQKMIEYLEQYC